MDHIFTAQALKEWAEGDPEAEALVENADDRTIEQALSEACRSNEDAFFAVWDATFSQAITKLKEA